MVYQRIIIACMLLMTLPLRAFAAVDDNTMLSVFANEAIVATYTYGYQNFLARQKDIAHYFTAQGWTAYSNALNDSKLPETIQQNNYMVSAVATMPPTIKTLHERYWQAIMPVLVVYKNPQHTQKQTLNVTIEFTTASTGQGVRGLAITSLRSTVAEAPCQCISEPNTNPTPRKP